MKKGQARKDKWRGKSVSQKAKVSWSITWYIFELHYTYTT